MKSNLKWFSLEAVLAISAVALFVQPAFCRSRVLAQESVPTICILPEDVVQESVQRFEFPGTNKFTVRWTYTEAGAKKMLAFRNEHDGREVVTLVGNFEFRGRIFPRDSYPPGWVDDEGWLKSRTDKFFGVSEEDAKKIIEGLRRSDDLILELIPSSA